MFEFLRKRSPADSAPAPVDAHAAEHATAAQPLAEAASAGPAPQPDDIAIIGLALRLPRAETLDDFWTELAAQRSLISEVSPQRWDKNVYYGDPRKEEDKTNSIWGGFIEHADCFDAEFFNISPREAQYMDPQQRFAMELAWKAIEDAGYRPGQLAGTNTGVYMGVCHWDYAELFEKTGQKVDAYFPTGTAYSIIANRVSHYYDLAGPSIVNDTACASSLVSVYQAVRAIRNGECDTALAGGVNLAWSVNHFIAFGKNGMLSKRGRSQAFDHEADGYVRGEGGAMLLLKPLQRALADGDSVYAVIKGIGTNHGGRTTSLTVTNAKAQARLIREVYTRAGIAPDSVSYIEAHGPGTPVGDPVEVLGLKEAFRDMHREAGSEPVPQSCGIGSVKTNIGHLEGAAGVAGMVKVIAAMRHRTLPGNVDFHQLNPLIKFEDSPFYVVGQSQPWATKGTAPRRAGVSSFGFGGTNAHVILEEGPSLAGADAANLADALQVAGTPVLVPLSARNGERLDEQIRQLAAHLRAHPELDLAALAYTLQIGREGMAERIAFVTDSVAELSARLDAALAATAPVERSWRGQAPVRRGRHDTKPAALDEDTELLVSHWIEKGRLDKLAEHWCGGGPVDWSRLHRAARPQRLRLPTYPFARVRHWLPEAEPAAATAARDTANATAPAALATLHPLLHENVSTLSSQAYRTAFAGTEFFLADHHVSGRMVLPGVAYLEMARAAAALAVEAGEHGTLKNVVWMRPLRVGAEPVEARMRLTPQTRGDVAYEVTSGAGDTLTVHSQGTIVAQAEPAAAPAAIDLNALRGACASPVALDEAYGWLRAAGMVHGPSLQAMSGLYQGERQVLVELSLPEALHAEAEAYRLHPSLLDAAIQGTVVLLRGERPALPFALRELRQYGPCATRMCAWIRPSAGAAGNAAMPAFDIDLCDAQGAVRVRLAGLSLRLLEAGDVAAADAAPTASTATLSYGVREWQAAPLTAPATPAANPGALVFVAGAAPDPQRDRQLAEALGASVEALVLPPAEQAAAGLEAAFQVVLRGVQRVMGERRKADVCIVLPDDEAGRLLAPLAALLQVALQESSRLRGRLMMVAGLAQLPAAALAERVRAELGASGAMHEVRYDMAGRRETNVVAPLALPAASLGEVLKPGGVYWLTGGLGGLGRLIAEAVAGLSGVVLVLSGRGPADGRDAALRARGVTLDYLVADVANAEDTQRVVAEILRRHGRLNGVLHAAGVLQDGLIVNKTAGQASSVFAPKVHGLANLDAATRGLTLDFMLLFSSVAAIDPAAGQADYAVANRFLDAYADYRDAQVRAGRAHGVTVAIDWPLWADGGMRMDATSIDAMRRRTGGEPLPSELGLGALAAVLAARRAGHVSVRYGHARVEAAPQPAPAVQAAAALETVEAVETAAAPAVDLMGETLVLLKQTLGKVLKLDPAKIRTGEKFEQYGFDSIMAVDMTLQLEELVGSLPKTLFFEYVDLQGIADYLHEEHAQALAAALAARRPAAVATAPAVATRAEPVAPAAPPAPAAIAAGPAGATSRFGVPAPALAPAAMYDGDLHDIAVIGLAGRYPRAATLDAFWELLKNGEHAFEKIPSERWEHAGIYHDERDVLGKSTIRTGGFLDDIDKFDPRYFNISQRDAELMSPEVRLFLQVGVEAFEDAGYSREQMRQRYDGDVGVLVGTMSNHYNLLGFQNMLTRGSRASGSYTGTLPNMLSYFYGFTGPSIFLDTMCSAASTCIDQGVWMLRTRQCRMVLAGGVNLLLHPQNLISSSQEHFTSKSSDVIRSYGLGTDGTILGEGLGAVLLKPLVEAIADGDHIYGVIKGTAINNAGVRNGFTVPTPAMQARAVEKALADARVDARTISYVEGHGSGTKLGDPIEIKALTQAYRAHTDERAFCAIGSVKSNIAHLLAAAGVVGLTKVLLQMKHATLVPSLHADELNPAIPFADSPFHVQRELAEWRRPTVVGADGVATTYPRRAGVTSIGAGGMNSHMIIEEYAAPEPAHWPAAPRLFVLSAMTRTLLQNWMERLVARLREQPGLDPARLAYTLQVGRNVQPCRFAMVASSLDDVIAALEAFLRDQLAPGAVFVDNVLSIDPSAGPGELDRDLAAGDLPRLARHWAEGARLDWRLLWPERAPHRLSLPPSPFEKVRCWYEVHPDAPSVLDPLASRGKLHPFIGRNLSDLSAIAYETDARPDDLLDYAYRRDGQRRIVPTFVLDAAWALGSIAGLTAPFAVCDLALNPEPDWSGPARLEFALATRGPGSHEVGVHYTGEDGVLRPLARFALQETAAPQWPATLGLEVGSVAAPLDGAAFYATLREGGLDYLPYLESVERLGWSAGGACLVTLREAMPKQHHFAARVALAPAVLGAVQQVAHFLARQAGETDWQDAGFVGADALEFAGGAVRHLRFEGRDIEGRHTIALLDDTGRVLGTIRGARFGRAALTGLAAMPVASGVTRPAAVAREAAAPAAAPALAPAPAAVAAAPAPAPAAAAPVVPAPVEAPDELARIRTDVVARILGRMAPILKFAPEAINLRTPFYHLGFDSISLTELAGQIGADLGVGLTPAVFFEVENVEQLAGHLMSNHGATLRTRHRPAQATPAPAVTRPVAAAGFAPAAPANASDPLLERAVAIIGMSARLPGADDLDAFWRNLREGRNTIAPLPMSRYRGAYREQMEQADFPHRAGVLHDIDRFDAAFFQISPAEAELMDPQHRLFLEAAWAAVEHAGYRASRLPEATGVYVGVSGNDYATLLAAHGVPTEAYTATGTAHSMLANRVSFFLDVHGPSQAIDTACSSSLVALHRAVESLRAGQCEMVIAGGVNLALSADTFVGAYKAGMLSPEAQCKTFSARADGYVRGEGVAALVLKPLRAAERDGDPILGVILGSAENHGGRANSLTAPNPRAQAELIRRAMHGIDPASIGYVEAHGTGTSLGDPVEINGLKLAYAQLPTEDGAPLAAGQCAIGSLKSNIGHLEAAAGVAGVLKVLLAMRHGALPASLQAEPLNPYIELDGSPFRIVRELTAWPRTADAAGRPRPRRAGVSSFGFGGANAHLVLQEYVAPDAMPAAVGPHAIVLSARTDAQLRIVARRLLAWARQAEGDAPAGLIERVAYTLQVGREPMDERLGFEAASLAQLVATLTDYLDDLPDAVLRGSTRRAAAPALPPAGAAMRETLRAWVDGAEIDWSTYHARVPLRVGLPTYPFAGQRHWIPAQAAPTLDDATLERMLDNVLSDTLSVDEAMDALTLADHGRGE
ncbi:SDR family NAD(P)-dependent oxidoreductase [Burkholderia gladioli]|jgi:polyketide synthase PksL|uniref:SDR family NAD(P)-dependent oxidoreductase n=1 Tax=Burkholderia gladioli TaxID=28095 RepID=UPI0016421481|nr:SDR family NAD(P)-dependent oxidoreductase [Burkholderia gladioli]